MIERFSGSVEQIALVYVDTLVNWISAIDFDQWPQQHRIADGKIRPAMVSDPRWHGFAERTEFVVAHLLRRHFPGCLAYQRMLSVVMPGHSIPAHRDEQAPYWLCRVHVPLVGDAEARFWCAGQPFVLTPGRAYKINTEAEHAVENRGAVPRIHLLFDVRRCDA